MYLFSSSSTDLSKTYIGQSTHSTLNDMGSCISDLAPSSLKTPLNSVIAHTNDSRHSPGWIDGLGWDRRGSEHGGRGGALTM